jgi:hypothetical protein
MFALNRKVLDSLEIVFSAANKQSVLAACYTLVSCLADSSSRQMEAIYSAAALVDFQRTTWCYVAQIES